MIHAFLLRELHAAFVNRLILFFAGAMLALGALPAALAPDAASETAAHVLLLGILYLVPLFAVLTGTASAQNETEEHPLLMSQPVWRGGRLLGKWLALAMVLAAGAFLLVIPAMLMGAAAKALALLGSQAAGLAAAFAALGLAVGFSCSDRLKAHMISLCLWLFFLLGTDLIALATAGLPVVQEHPDWWLAAVMLNPLDSFRVGALLALNRIPFDPLTAPPLASWWIAHLALWFFLITAAWSLLFLLWGNWKLARAEP